SSASRAARAAGASGSVVGSSGANGHPGEGLVDVHAMVLLPVSVEADHPAPAQQVRDLGLLAQHLELQAPQKAVAADHQLGGAQPLLEPLERLNQVVIDRGTGHGREHDAVLYRTVEGQAAVL